MELPQPVDASDECQPLHGAFDCLYLTLTSTHFTRVPLTLPVLILGHEQAARVLLSPFLIFEPPGKRPSSNEIDATSVTIVALSPTLIKRYPCVTPQPGSRLPPTIHFKAGLATTHGTQVTMAEPVSSIITIATVGLALVRACKNYIEAVREIDDLVDRLLERITELHGVVRLLNSKYHQAEPDGNSEPSILVREKIALCRDRLREIKRKIADLGLQSKSAETFLDKASVKRRMDTVAKDIEFAVDDIRRYLGDIVLVTGACSYLFVRFSLRLIHF